MICLVSADLSGGASILYFFKDNDQDECMIIMRYLKFKLRSGEHNLRDKGRNETGREIVKNNNDERVVNLWTKNELVLINTKFKHKEIKHKKEVRRQNGRE